MEKVVNTIHPSQRRSNVGPYPVLEIRYICTHAIRAEETIYPHFTSLWLKFYIQECFNRIFLNIKIVLFNINNGTRVGRDLVLELVMLPEFCATGTKMTLNFVHCIDIVNYWHTQVKGQHSFCSPMALIHVFGASNWPMI